MGLPYLNDSDIVKCGLPEMRPCTREGGPIFTFLFDMLLANPGHI